MSWLNRILGRSGTPTAEPPPTLTTGPDEPVPAVDIFAKLGDIKGESKDAPPEPPDALATEPTAPEPGAEIYLKLKGPPGESKDATPEEPAAESQPGPPNAPGAADTIDKDETITIHGARTEDAGIPGLHKADDVTLKRGTFGPEDDGGFDVKLEQVVPAAAAMPSAPADPDAGGEVEADPDAGGEIALGAAQQPTPVVPLEPVGVNFSKMEAPAPADPQEGGEAIPTEEMSLNYSKIQFEYKDTGESKTAADDNDAGYDLTSREGGGPPEPLPHKGEIEIQSWSISPPSSAEPAGGSLTHEVGHWMGDEPPPDGPGSLGTGPGAPTDGPHKEEIEIDSYSWGASPASAGADSLTGGAEPQEGYLKFELKDAAVANYDLNKDSPEPLPDAGAGGGPHLKEVPGDDQAFLKLELKDVLVSSYQTGGSGADAPPPDADSFAKSSPVLSDIPATKEMDKGTSSMSQAGDDYDDDEGTLASLHVQEPGAVAATIGTDVPDPLDDLPDFDIDADADADDMDVEV